MDKPIVGQPNLENQPNNREVQVVPAPAVEVQPLKTVEPPTPSGERPVDAEASIKTILATPRSESPAAPATTPARPEISPSHLEREIAKADNSSIIAIANRANEQVNELLAKPEHQSV